MNTPDYLKNILSEISVVDDFQLNATLSPEDNCQFYIFTQAVMKTIDDTLYLVSEEEEDYYLNDFQIIIQPINSHEQYMVFDSNIHGYDNLFCNKHRKNTTPLKKIELNGSSIFTGTILLSYGIDYEEEKEDYNIENGMVRVLNREVEKISWQQIKEEGYDWITLSFVNEKGDKLILDEELA